MNASCTEIMKEFLGIVLKSEKCICNIINEFNGIKGTWSQSGMTLFNK